MFHIRGMARIDSDTLALHLEVALTCAPPDTLNALQDTDSSRRRRAAFTLARHLADRMGCFEVTEGDLGDYSAQGSLL